MFALAIYTLAFTLGQTVEVRLAPDQPAPLFFIDEPLVVQVRADAATSVALDIEVDLPDGRRATWKPGPLALSPGRAQWLTMDGLPALRGPHVFHIHTAPDADPVERTLARIDRPAPGGEASIVLAIASPSPSARYAAQCIGAGIQFPLEWPALDAEVTAFAHPDRGPIYVQITAFGGRHPRSVEAAVAALAGRVDIWTVKGAISPRESIRESTAARGADPGAAWAPRVAEAREVAGLVERGGARIPDALIAAPEAAAAIAGAAARAGFERMPLILDLADDPTSVSLPGLLTRLMTGGLGPGRVALVPQGLLETPEGFSGALAMLAATRRQLADAQSLGVFAGAGENTVWILRLGPSAAPDTWALVAAVSDPTATLPAILPGDGAEWDVLDAYGNSLGDFGRPGGRVAFPAGAGAWYARGHGGTLLREALAARVRALASAAMSYEGELATAASETAGALEVLARYELPAPARLQFFALLRALPAIEESWRRGLLETRDAIPMTRDLAAIAEALAILEQELEESLLEPLDNTLDTCAEWIARYPSASGNDPRDANRIAFLRGEVLRLADRARAWASAGRMTEAKSVAAIAEWRARSLEAAATIPWPENAEDSAIDEPAAPDESSEDGQSPDAETELETEAEVDE